MLSQLLLGACLTALAGPSVTAMQRTAGTSVTVQQHWYQTVRAAPFNGQLAFYAGEISSAGGTVKLPVTVHVLIGRGQRPFPVDAGSMTPEEFSRHIARLEAAGAVTVTPFTIQKEGQRATVDFFRKAFTVTAANLIPCNGCPGRVVLTIE